MKDKKIVRKRRKVFNHIVTKQFNCFDEFMDQSRDEIYDAITNCFLELVKTDPDSSLTINIKATIQNKSFKTKFCINEETINYLTEIIMPYYIEKEEYEKCIDIQSILKIYK